MELERTVCRFCIVLAFVAWLPSCARDRSVKNSTSRGRTGELDQASRSMTRAPHRTLDNAARHVLRRCEVAHWGFVRKGSCKDPKALADLKAQERALGPSATLLAYCKLVGEDDARMRALASFRISRMGNYSDMKTAANAEVFDCLVEKLAAQKETTYVFRMARAVALMGTALGQDERVIEVLDAHPRKAARLAGYQALWANGRLRVLPKLKSIIESEGEDIELRRAAIRGFGRGPALSTKEMAVVCRMLEPLMLHQEVELAASAAHRVATSCKGYTDRVVAAAEKVFARKAFNLAYVNALSSAAGYFEHRSEAKQVEAIKRLLARILAASWAPELTRSSALRTIYRLDPPLGKKLAKVHHKDKSTLVREAASRIVAMKVRAVERSAQ